jgi:hypothetical protein
VEGVDTRRFSVFFCVHGFWNDALCSSFTLRGFSWFAGSTQHSHGKKKGVRRCLFSLYVTERCDAMSYLLRFWAGDAGYERMIPTENVFLSLIFMIPQLYDTTVEREKERGSWYCRIDMVRYDMASLEGQEMYQHHTHPNYSCNLIITQTHFSGSTLLSVLFPQSI